MAQKACRLIHTIPAVSEEASGPSYSVVRLCGSLIDQNCDITLVTLSNGLMAGQKMNFLKVFPSGLGLNDLVALLDESMARIRGKERNAQANTTTASG